MDRDTFIGVLAGLEAGRRISKAKLSEFYAEAGKRGINLVRPGTFASEAPVVQQSLARRAVGTVARRSPWIVGGAAGLELVRHAPDLYEDVMERWDEAQATVGIPAQARTKRKLSKFNKAVSAGMKAVKRSKSFGKPGSISNGKKAFATVTKTVSGIKKGRKAPRKGIRGTIARAVKRIL
jgi:hypothetical protein